MAKKVKIKGAKQVSPKPRGLVALLISFCIVFFSFPFSATADNRTAASNLYYQFHAVNGYSNTYNVVNDTDCTSNIDAKDLYTASVTITFPLRHYNKGDVVSFDVQDMKPVWIDKVNFNVYMDVIIDDTTTTFKRGHGLLADNQQIKTTYTFDNDCNASFKLQFDYSVFVIKHTYESEKAWFGLNASLSSKSETNGLLDTIIQFVKGIFENIKELPSKIGDFLTNLSNSLKQWFSDVGEWFSNLGDNLKQWFTNLGDNLRQWFANVGDWFSSLGDKIGGFFTDIFNKIKEFFTSLFKPHDGYFDEVRNDLDAYLAAHLGIAYTAIPAILEFTKRIFTDVSTAYQGSPIITLPAINIPIGDNTIHLLDSVSVNLDDYMSTDDNMQNVLTILFGISDTLLNVGAFICFCRVVYKKFINKVGVEGGDDV